MAMTRLDSDERRKAIVTAAVPLFARKGFAGTITKELAEAAGISEALLFRHFPSKKHLYDEILRLYGKAGATPEVVQLPPPVPHGAVQRFLLASRNGVFIAPDEAESYPAANSEVVAVPLDEPGAKIEVHMAWRKNETSATVMEFLKSMREYFRNGVAPKARKPRHASGKRRARLLLLG